jgi:hypothetical protein
VTWKEQKRTSKTKTALTDTDVLFQSKEEEMITKLQVSVVKQDRGITQNY